MNKYIKRAVRAGAVALLVFFCAVWLRALLHESVHLLEVKDAWHLLGAFLSLGMCLGFLALFTMLVILALDSNCVETLKASFKQACVNMRVNIHAGSTCGVVDPVTAAQRAQEDAAIQEAIRRYKSDSQQHPGRTDASIMIVPDMQEVLDRLVRKYPMFTDFPTTTRNALVLCEQACHQWDLTNSQPPENIETLWKFISNQQTP